MAIGTTLIYNSAFLRIGNGTFDFDGNTLRGFLAGTGSNAMTPTLSTFADITNELSTANGYSAGGANLANVSWSESGGVSTLDFDDPTWTPTGGDIVAKFFGIYALGTLNSITNPLLAAVDLDTTSASSVITRSVGDVFRIIVPSTGFFRLGAGTLT